MRLRRLLTPVLAGALGLGCTSPQKPDDPPAQGGEQSGPQAGGGFDVSAMIEAQPSLALGAGAQVGWRATQQLRAAGQTLVNSYAIVGQTADCWQVERVDFFLSGLAGSPEAAGMIIGLTVRKEDGVVTAAVVGRAGEAGKPVKVGQAPHAPQSAVSDEDAKLKIGTYPARKHVTEDAQGTTTSWVGHGGDLNGVLLKTEGAGGEYELAREPSDTQLKVGGTAISVTEYAYTNGRTDWIAANEPILAVLSPAGDGRAVVKSVTGDTTTEFVELGRDARPQLKW